MHAGDVPATGGRASSPAASAPVEGLPGRPRLTHRLHNDGRSVTEHLGHSAHYLGRVVTHPDDGVGADLRRVVEHELERVGAGAFTQRREKRNVAAEHRLYRGAEGAHDGARAYHESANDAER